LSEEHRLRVFEMIFGHKWDEVTGGWRRLHNEELNDLQSSPDIFWVIKSRRMRCVGHIAHMGRTEMHTGFWWGNQRERDNLENPGINWRIILKWIFKQWDGWHGLDSSGLE